MLKHKNTMLAIIKVVYNKVTITNPYGEQGWKKKHGIPDKSYLFPYNC